LAFRPGVLVIAPPSRAEETWFSRLRRLIRPPRRLKLTREGRFYILITFGVGFVGILTANNLLYVLLGMLLSLIIVSGVLSEASLRDIRVTRRLPQRAQVGRPHLVEVQVWNDKKKLPSYAIEVEDLRLGQPADKRCFFLKVSPGSSQVAAYRRIPGRRGLDRHSGFRVATRFPFGLFEKSRTFEEAGDLIIYPAVDPVRLGPSEGDMGGEGSRIASRGGGDDILGVRVMREGDDPRDIYWRRSVGIGPPVVMERAREVRRLARMTLDNVYAGDTEAPSDEYLAHFERKVRDLASRAVAHVRRGERVRLETTSGARAEAHPEGGTDNLLRFLALVDVESANAGPHPAGKVRLAASRSSEPDSGRTSIVPAPPNLSRPAKMDASRISEADLE
jgi:uncharacterized protein (DUF58 family)